VHVFTCSRSCVSKRRRTDARTHRRTGAHMCKQQQAVHPHYKGTPRGARPKQQAKRPSSHPPRAGTAPPHRPATSPPAPPHHHHLSHAGHPEEAEPSSSNHGAARASNPSLGAGALGHRGADSGAVRHMSVAKIAAALLSGPKVWNEKVGGGRRGPGCRELGLGMAWAPASAAAIPASGAVAPFDTTATFPQFTHYTHTHTLHTHAHTHTHTHMRTHTHTHAYT